MKKTPVKNKRQQHWFTKWAPYVTLAILLVVSYFVLFQSNAGLNEAQAQTNPGRIGDTVVDTVTGAAAEHNAEIAEAEGELNQDEPVDQTEDEPMDEPVDDPLSEPMPISDEPVDEGGEEASEEEAVNLYQTSRQGLGGTDIREMSREELFDALLLLAETGGRPRVVEGLMPVVLRFQAMISPPLDTEMYSNDDDATPPWLSGERRYSPFDPVGGGEGPPRGPVLPAAPFISPLPDIPGPGPEDGPTAVDVANAIRLVGVFGGEGAYRAILSFQGEELEVGVGEIITTIGETTFTVGEISLRSLRIQNATDEYDTGLVQFGESEGISGISISY